MANPFDVFRPQVAKVIGLLFILVLFVTMVYGPIAAMLVELFPTRIRYTSMSLPYHIGNGWFGGLLPATAFAMVAQTGDIYFGLWYPIIIAVATVIVGVLFVPETKDRDIFDGPLSEPTERLDAPIGPAGTRRPGFIRGFPSRGRLQVVAIRQQHRCDRPAPRSPNLHTVAVRHGFMSRIAEDINSRIASYAESISRRCAARSISMIVNTDFECTAYLHCNLL